MSTAMLLGFPEYAAQAQALADAAAVDYSTVEIHRFPDGESRIRLPESLPPRVVFCRSLHVPNDKLIEIMLAARTARELGARHLTLVAPYLCYMRQDVAFQPGEVVSQRMIGGWLAELFGTVITVDPHLHRVHRFDEAVPARRAVSLSAAPLMAEFLCAHVPGALLLGPDSESRQWVANIAVRFGAGYAVAQKQRHDERMVDIALPSDLNLQDRTVVLVDDMATTGRTLATCAAHARAAGARNVHCLVTHALFVGDAEQVMRAAGITHIWSSDSIPHPTNVVPLAALLATALVD